MLPIFLLTAAWPAVSAGALQKYRLNTVNLVSDVVQTPIRTHSPFLFPFRGPPPAPPFDTAWIDASTVPAPVLVRFRFRAPLSTTIAAPVGPQTSVFLRYQVPEGPGPLRKPKTFTGTGSTAAGSTLAWGVVTGWTVSGSVFCRASPPVLCEFAGDESGHEVRHDTTIDPLLTSDFFDLGTWFFHETGFTAVPFVHRYNDHDTGSYGNTLRWFRGVAVRDATVPALPLAGLALLGASLLLGAAAHVRRGRR